MQSFKEFFISSCQVNAISLSVGTFDLYVRGNFTISKQEWSACLQKYIIEVNEITVNGNKPCRPYRIIVYKRTVDADGTGTGCILATLIPLPPS